MDIQATNNHEHYSRNYETLLDSFGNIGGITEFILCFILIAYASLNELAMEKTLVKDVMRQFLGLKISRKNLRKKYRNFDPENITDQRSTVELDTIKTIKQTESIISESLEFKQIIKNKILNDIFSDFLFDERHLKLLSLIISDNINPVDSPNTPLHDPIDEIEKISKIPLDKREEIFEENFRKCEKRFEEDPSSVMDRYIIKKLRHRFKRSAETSLDLGGSKSK